MSELNIIKNQIQLCLNKLYTNDEILFDRNNGNGLCERCLVFRFGLYLQETFPNYFVDCDFNSAILNGRLVSGKPITNLDYSTTNRFVDIIVHKRTQPPGTDFICFEIKKWNNTNKYGAEKDRNNLRVLTSQYGYEYGFDLIFGKTIETTKWAIFRNGSILEDMRRVTIR
ncbi:MAG: hypothetical protein WC532_06315 [Candidatus Omnitrophota bacterium]